MGVAGGPLVMGKNISLLPFGHLALAGATSIPQVLLGGNSKPLEQEETSPHKITPTPAVILLQTEILDAFQAEGGGQLFLSSGNFVPQSHPWPFQEVEIQFSG